MLVKSPGGDDIVRFTAKVKMPGKLLPQVLCRRDPSSREIVQGGVILARTQLLKALKWRHQAQAAQQFVHFILIRLATITGEEFGERRGVEIRGSDIGLHGASITFLPVPEQIGEQVAGPA